MTDQELLKLAAKAAGLSHLIEAKVFGDEYADQWNPLADDGDALRLAVKRRMSICLYEDNSVIVSYLTGKGTVRCWTECFNDDNAEELVRRAITSLAAGIGKEMK